MQEGESIISLFIKHRENIEYHDKFPFTVRQTNWTKDFYVIVEDVQVNNYPYGVAKGVPMNNGALSRLFIGDQIWAFEQTIPKCNHPIWEYVESINSDEYKDYNTPVIYELKFRTKWGKHKGLSIEEICQINLGYIEWCIYSLETNFCLSENAVTELLKSGILFDDKVLALNMEKLKWFQSDFSDELKPSFYDKEETIERTADDEWNLDMLSTPFDEDKTD